jgi:hypothetical protein
MARHGQLRLGIPTKAQVHGDSKGGARDAEQGMADVRPRYRSVARETVAVSQRGCDPRTASSSMAVEIERKFLVRCDGWRNQVTRQQEIKDGLIAIAGGRQVRREDLRSAGNLDCEVEDSRSRECRVRV